MTVRQILQILWARRRLFSILYAGIVLLALVGSLIWPKTYLAEASVVVDSKSTDPVSGTERASELLPSNIATQVDVISSHNVGLKVVDKLKLAANPEFQQIYQKATDGEGSIRDWIADYLFKRLEVIPSRDSHVIEIDLKSRDPRFSADLANAYAEAYIQTSLELKSDPARRQVAWFDEQLKSLRNDLEGAQTKLSQYQRTKSVVGTNDQIDIENTRLAEISNQLIAAQATMYEGQMRLKQMNQALQRDELGELPDILGNGLLQSMKADLARSESKLAEMAERFGKNHPLYISAGAEVKALQSKLLAEVNTVKGAIQQSAELSTRQEAELRRAMAEQRDHILELKRQHDELDVLKREVDSAQRAYDAALQRESQVRLESELDQSNIAVLNSAVPPVDPHTPKLLLNMAIAIVLGFMISVAVVLSTEVTDRRVRSGSDFADLVGVVVLAEIPKFERRTRRSRLLKGPTKFFLPSVQET